MRPPAGILTVMENMLTESALTTTLQEAAATLTLTMVRAARVPLLSVHAAPMAATYGIWVNEPLYMAARWIVYIGSTSNMRRRVTEHRQTYRDCQGIEPENVLISVLPSSTHALAQWAESSLLEHVRPAINLVLPGSGCKGRGRVREAGNPTPFRVLHPRVASVADPVAQEHLRRQVIAHLSKTAAPDWCMDQLRRPD